MFYNILLREDKKLILTKINLEQPPKYSYSRIPMSDKDLFNLLIWLRNNGNTEVIDIWNKGDRVVIDPEKYPEVLSSFMKKVREAKEDETDFEAVPNKILQCLVPGTSALLRNKERTVIKVVRRKDQKTKINKVAVSNSLRDEFFAAVKKTHGRPSNSNYCLFIDDGDIYQYWNKLMDQLYYVQLNMSEQSVPKKEVTDHILICKKDTSKTLPQARSFKFCGGCGNANKCWSGANKKWLNKTYFTDYR